MPTLVSLPPSNLLIYIERMLENTGLYIRSFMRVYYPYYDVWIDVPLRLSSV